MGFREDRIEDVGFMADHGEDLNGAARRLGIQPASIERFLNANGEFLILEKLKTNMPELNTSKPNKKW